MRQKPFSTWTNIQWARASVIVLMTTWVPPMFRSLWNDELGSYWAIEGSLAQTITRATDFHGQSPFTYVLMWSWNRALAPSDFGLRVLPLVFSLGTMVVLFRIGRRIGDDWLGWLSVVALASFYEARVILLSFRPYAFAVFFFALSTLVVMRWAEKPSKASALAYILSAAATIWSVFYFVIPIAFHALYLMALRRNREVPSNRSIAAVVGGVFVLCLPLVPQLVSLAGRSETLQFSGTPSVRVVLEGSIPIGTAAALLLITVACGLPRVRPMESADRILISWIAIGTTGALYLLTLSTDLGLWTVRYRSAFLLGFALAVGVWISSYDSDKVAIRALVILVSVGLLVSPPRDFTSTQDWRGGLALADQAIGEDGLIILGSGLVESASFELLADPYRSTFNLAPLSRYPVRQATLLAPLADPEKAYPYLVRALMGLQYEQLAVVSIAADRPSYETFYVDLAPLGYEQTEKLHASGIQVLIFERTGDSHENRGSNQNRAHSSLASAATDITWRLPVAHIPRRISLASATYLRQD